VTNPDSSSEKNDGPLIVSYPGAVNHYDYDHDVVVLDSRLDEFPKAQEEIKTHEVEHADARTTLEYLRHELQSDTRMHFSNDEEIEEVRRYYDEIEPEHTPSRLTLIGMRFVDLLRAIWTLLMSPVGSLYREYHRGVEGAQTNDDNDKTETPR